MKNYIVNIVNKLCAKYRTVNPFEIAEILGIHVWYPNLKELKGFYNIQMKERYIAINDNLCDEEKKIVCAHELGHDRLHQCFAKYTPFHDTMLYDVRLKPEREANIFAAELLISDDDISNCEAYTISEIAQILGVNEIYVKLKVDLMQKRNR